MNLMLFVVWIPNPDGQYDVETLTPPAWSICGPAARLCSPKPPCTPLMRLGWLFRHPKNSELNQLMWAISPSQSRHAISAMTMPGHDRMMTYDDVLL